MKRNFFLLLLLLFCTIGNAEEESEFSEAMLPLEDLRVFAESFKRIRSSYVDDITDQDLLILAIKGMLAELDPHSVYLDKEAIKNFEESTSGNYGGLGIEIIKEQSFIKVISPIDDTPASRAGIESGDLITNLDGISVKGMSISDAVKIMRGEPETNISLSILKKGTSEVIDLNLTRQLVKVSSVSQRYLEEGFGYLRIAQFQARTAQEVREAIIKLKDSGNLNGLIIDLRNNPGGILRAAVDVADTFLEEGLIVYTLGRLEESKNRYKARPGDMLSGLPIVTLVNEGSASASEILAGALQDQERSIVMGTNTFGKGSVQTIIPITETRAVKLTTARYFTPNGRSIQAEGIIPDIKVPRHRVTPRNRNNLKISEKNLSGHLTNKNSDGEKVDNKTKKEESDLIFRDFQLYQALNVLTGLHKLNSKPRPND
jgi:carboxyl-terminal processing protease